MNGTARDIERDKSMVVLASMRYGAEDGRTTNLIHDRFDMNPTRFWQKVWQLVEDPEIVRALPAEVNRLNWLRFRQRQARVGRRAV